MTWRQLTDGKEMGQPGLTELMGSSAQSAGFYPLAEHTDMQAGSSRDVSPTAWTGPLGRDKRKASNYCPSNPFGMKRRINASVN